MEAEVSVVVDVPHLKPRATLAARLARVAAFKAALDKAHQELKRLDTLRGRWLDVHRLQKRIAKAKYAKCHKTRMGLLAEFAPPPPVVNWTATATAEPIATIQGGLFA